MKRNFMTSNDVWFQSLVQKSGAKIVLPGHKSDWYKSLGHKSDWYKSLGHKSDWYKSLGHKPGT